MINLLYINLLVVLVWDYLNYPNEVAGMIMGRLTNGRIRQVELVKPFGCSLCMVFILSFIYLACNTINWCSIDSITLYTLIAVLNGVITQYTFSTILLINDLLNKILIKINIIIKKIFEYEFYKRGNDNN